MRPKSLRINLILWFTFVFSLVIFISDYVTYKELREIMLAELNSSLVSMARLDGEAFKESNRLDPKATSNQANQYPRFMRQFAQILDRDGRVLDQTGLPQSSGPVINQSQLSAALNGQDVTADLLIDGKQVRLAAVGAVR